MSAGMLDVWQWIDKLLTWVACLGPSPPGLKGAGRCTRYNDFMVLAYSIGQETTHDNVNLCPLTCIWVLACFICIVYVRQWIDKLLTWVVWLDPSLFRSLKVANRCTKMSWFWNNQEVSNLHMIMWISDHGLVMFAGIFHLLLGVFHGLIIWCHGFNILERSETYTW